MYPLVRKLNTLGTRVMLLGWDFEYHDDRHGELRTTRTAQGLIDEVTYPVLMSDVIDDRAMRNSPIVANLFMAQVAKSSTVERHSDSADGSEAGSIRHLGDGWGFISPKSGGPDLYFYHADLGNSEFGALRVGQAVRFGRSTNDKGPCALNVTVLGRAGEEGVASPADPA